jgi:hypothetical protein
VAVSSGIDLYLTQGQTEDLLIKGSEKLIRNLDISQQGGLVIIKYKSGVNISNFFSNEGLKVYLSYKNLNSITASGGSDVYTTNPLKANQLAVIASGGSDVDLKLQVSNLNLTLSGGSDAKLTGAGESLQASISGGSDLNAFAYPVNYAKLKCTGGSDGNVFVNKALETNVSGGSDVTYKGKATLRDTSSSKSSDVRHIQ